MQPLWPVCPPHPSLALPLKPFSGHTGIRRGQAKQRHSLPPFSIFFFTGDTNITGEEGNLISVCFFLQLMTWSSFDAMEVVNLPRTITLSSPQNRNGDEGEGMDMGAKYGSKDGDNSSSTFTEPPEWTPVMIISTLTETNSIMQKLTNWIKGHKPIEEGLFVMAQNGYCTYIGCEYVCQHIIVMNW